MSTYISFLKNKNFILYNIGQMFSQFADRLFQIAIIGIVYKISPGSTVQLAKVMFFTLIPAFIISPIAGIYVDRFPKKFVLVFSDLARGIIVLFIGVIFINCLTIIPIYASIFLIFTVACFFLPAKLAIIPELVENNMLLMANSISTALWIIGGIIGFMSGAFIVEFLGLKKGLIVTFIAYILSAMAIAFIKLKIEQRHESKHLHLKPKSFIHDLKEGILYLLTDEKTKAISILFFALMSIGGSLYVVMLVFIQEVTKSVTVNIGIFGAFLCIGFLIGSYLYGKYGQNLTRIKAILLSFTSSGFFIFLFALFLKLTGSLFAGNIILFFLGLSIAPVIISGNTLMHETIDTKLRGRIFSSLGIIMNAGFITFMFLSSYMAERIDRFWIIVVCGLILCSMGIVGYILRMD